MIIMDLKVKSIEQEVEAVLDSYPENYKNAFMLPDLRQKLISYVYHKTPGSYLVIKWDNKRRLIKQYFALKSQELFLQIEAHIHNGIKQIFEENIHLYYD